VVEREGETTALVLPAVQEVAAAKINVAQLLHLVLLGKVMPEVLVHFIVVFILVAEVVGLRLQGQMEPHPHW